MKNISIKILSSEQFENQQFDGSLFGCNMEFNDFAQSLFGMLFVLRQINLFNRSMVSFVEGLMMPTNSNEKNQNATFEEKVTVCGHYADYHVNHVSDWCLLIPRISSTKM